VKKRSSTKLDELREVLERGGVHKTSELANELDVSNLKVNALVHDYRAKFLNGENLPYIYSAMGGGYTMDDSGEHVAWESKKRISMGYSVIANGVFVFKRCRKIAAKEFAALNIAYRPQMLTVKQLLAKDVE